MQPYGRYEICRLDPLQVQFPSGAASERLYRAKISRALYLVHFSLSESPFLNPWHQLFRRYRKLPDPNAGRIVDRICDRSRHSGNSNFANSTSSNRIEDVVGFLDEMNINERYICVRRHEVVAEVCVCVATGSILEPRTFK